MAQIRVKTELQDDFSTLQPFQLPAPIPDTAQNFHYPYFQVVADGDGMVNVFCNLSYAGINEITNIFRDPKSSQWTIEETGFQHVSSTNNKPSRTTPIAILQDSTSGLLHIAYGVTDSRGMNTLFYLDPNSRYPRWRSTPISNLKGSTTVVFSRALDMHYDENGQVCVTCMTESPNADARNTSTGWIWRPKALVAPTIVSELEGFATTTLLKYGQYQDRAVDTTLHGQRGYHLASGYVQGGITMTEIYRSTIHDPTVPFFPVTQDGPFVSQQVIFLGDRNAAPLLLGVLGSPRRACLITNSQYTRDGQGSNLQFIFEELAMTKRLVWIGGCTRGGGDSNAETQLSIMNIDVFALFQVDDQSLELWHIETDRGAVFEVEDGIYSVKPQGWSAPARIATDILSNKNFPFTWTDNLASVFVVDDVPTCVVLNQNRQLDMYTRESELGTWSKSTIRSNLASLASSPNFLTDPNTSNIYFVEITSLMPDGTVIPDLKAQVGSDSMLTVQINGSDYVLDPMRSPRVEFLSNGLLSFKIPNRGELIPPTFWVWFEGMDEGEKIDIQAGPGRLHDRLKAIGSPGQKSLGEITLDDGKPLVPPGQSQDNLDHATTALHSVSEVITGDAAASPEDQRFIYKSTSLNVARYRATNASVPRLGRLRGTNFQPFEINFKNGVRFRYLTAQELGQTTTSVNGLRQWFSDLIQNIASGIYGVLKVIINKIGDFFQATVHFIVDGVEKVFQGIIEFASEAAYLAVWVFDAIKTGIERVIEWLKFMFNLDDIRRTARKFQGILNQATPALLDFINNEMTMATDAAFKYVRDNLDGFCDTLVQSLGSKTISSLGNQSFEVKNRSLLPNSRHLKNSDSVFSGQDLIDSLPSSASYFFEKFRQLVFGDSSFSLTSDLGLQEFVQDFEDIVSQIVTNETKADFQAAVQSLRDFISSFLTRGLLEGETIAALINVIKALLHLGLDMVQVVLQLLIKLFRFAVSQLTSLISDEVNIVGLTQLFKWFMQGDSCTMGGVTSLCLAVPYTLLYKSITGEAPFRSSVATTSTKGISPNEGHLYHGIISICTSTYGLFDDFTKLRDVPEPGYVVILRMFNSAGYQPIPLIPLHDASGHHVEGALASWSPSTGVHICSSLDTLCTVTNIVIPYIFHQDRFSALRDNAPKVIPVLQGIAGILGTICSIAQLADDKPPYDSEQYYLEISSLLTSVGGIAKFMQIANVDIRVKKAAAVWKCVFLISGAGCQIAAAYKGNNVRGQKMDALMD